MVKKRSVSVPRKARSGPYVWEYTSASKTKKMRAHKRRGLVSVPQSAMNMIANQLGKNVSKLYLTSPESVRNVLMPHMKRHKKVSNLRGKINIMSRTALNTRRVNPGYIRIVRRLQELNRTPNENYERRGEYSTGWHSRRIQSMMNLLRRLGRPMPVGDPNQYYNATHNRTYHYEPKSKHLTVSPNHPRGVYVTVAKGLNRKPNGTLYFNLRKRHDRKRGR